MLGPDIQIIRQIQEAKTEPDGRVTQIIRCDFLVGKHGPFSERIPKDEFTLEEKERRIEAFARNVR